MTREGGSDAGPDDDRGPDPDADAEEVARTLVLRHLTAQARTRGELERMLARKKVPEAAATTVLDRMAEVGLVDDEAFAQSWVESRQRRRHLSRTALRRELQLKGVEPELITEATAGVDADAEYSAARELATKKLRGLARYEPEVRRRRLAGVLARRGFDPSTIYRVLGELQGAPADGAAEPSG